MGFAARLDDMGKPAWIGVLVLTFIIVLAGRPGSAGLLDMEWTHGMR